MEIKGNIFSTFTLYLMARILTGIQSTGTTHLGNLLGAIIPAVELAKSSENESFLFIADLHSLTQVKDSALLKENTYKTAAAWLACGLDPSKTTFYRQSDIPQVTELSWYLSCFFPFNRLTLAHSFKDKKERLNVVDSLVSSGLEIIDINLNQMSSFGANCIQLNGNNGPVLVMSSKAYSSFTNAQLDIIQKNSKIIHSSLENIENNSGGSARCMIAEVF